MDKFWGFSSDQEKWQEKLFRKIYLWFLPLPWWWSNMVKMEDCKKRKNSISVARWGTNWGEINPFASTLHRHIAGEYWDIIQLNIFPHHQAFVPYYLSERGPNFEFDFSIDDWAAALPSPQGVKYFRPCHCHSNCSPISPKWDFIFSKTVFKLSNFLWGWFYRRATSK